MRLVRSQLLGMISDPSHLDFTLNMGFDCDKSYFSSFIFIVGRGRDEIFMQSQLLGVARDPSHLDFLL